METVIHLVRHGEVENPKGVIYGRLPGYNLSERGKRQAAAAARHLAAADVGLVWTSPLERAQETAAIVAEPHALDVTIDHRLIESDTTLEGIGRTLGAILRSPHRWWHLRNPLRPSWGESFVEIQTRMVEAIDDAVAAAGGRDVVLVSHQTPVLVARRALTRGRRPPWAMLSECATGSVTTVVLDGRRVLRSSYFASDV
ncbi:MAG TPA: histidine phosphatase family protein [Actinomycetota bacterium]|nr:histidine phosphatase family protein [Actinomycetota bacterium]